MQMILELWQPVKLRSLQAQVALVKELTSMNLNLNKCEIVVFSRSKRGGPDMRLMALFYQKARKCLSYWWERDLLATRAVEENIKKAWRPFFHYGSIVCLFFPG